MTSWQQSSNNTAGSGSRAFKDIEMPSHQPYIDANEQFHNITYMPDLTLDPRLSNTAGDMSGNMTTDMAEQQMMNASFWNPNINNPMTFFDNRVPGTTDMDGVDEDDPMVAPEDITSQRTTTKTRSSSANSGPTPRTRSMTSSRSSVPSTSASSRSSVPSANSAPSDRNQKARKEPRKEPRKGKQQAPRQRKQSNAFVPSRKNSLPEEQGENLEEDDSRRDRFLERNRIAASKCRQKKKVWVHDLEGTKQELESLNNSLHHEHNALVSELTRMKNMLMSHASCHDPNIDQWIDNEARRFVQNTADRFSTMKAHEPASRVHRHSKRGE